VVKFLLRKVDITVVKGMNYEYYIISKAPFLSSRVITFLLRLHGVCREHLIFTHFRLRKYRDLGNTAIYLIGRWLALENSEIVYSP